MAPRYSRIFFALVLGLLVAAPVSRAASPTSKKVRIAVLPVKLKGISGKTGRLLGRSLFRELRQLGVFRFISPKLVAKRLRFFKRKRLFRGHCVESPRCLVRLGRSLKAAVVFNLLVEKQADGVSVAVSAFDGRSGQAIRKHVEKSSEQQADMLRAVRWAVRLASGPMLTTLRRGKGKLRIDSTVAGAQLLLNGKNFGKRTGKTFKVGAGVFDVRVQREGYQTFRDVVVVKPNQQVKLTARLERSEEVPEATGAVAASVPKPAPAVPPPVSQQKNPAPSAAPKPQSETKKKELPAWAIFEKPQNKPPPLVLNRQGQAVATGTGGTAATGSVTAEQIPPPPPRRERRFYQTWWFWTIVGAVVAGGGGTAAYFLTRGGSEGPAGTGTALVGWQ